MVDAPQPSTTVQTDKHAACSSPDASRCVHGLKRVLIQGSSNDNQVLEGGRSNKSATVVPHPASNAALFCTEMHKFNAQKTLYCTTFLEIAPTCTDLPGGLIIVMSAVQVRLSPPSKREGRKSQKSRPFALDSKQTWLINGLRVDQW
jgi:hypothetical protein